MKYQNYKLSQFSFLYSNITWQTFSISEEENKTKKGKGKDIRNVFILAVYYWQNAPFKCQNFTIQVQLLHVYAFKVRAQGYE